MPSVELASVVASPVPAGSELEAYDATGRLVDRLATDVKAGVGVINWKPRDLGAGLYFLKVKTPGQESVLKALLTD